MAVPHVFAPNTTIRSSDFNENFEYLDTDFTGGEVSGSIFPSTNNSLDLGTALKAFRSVYMYTLQLADTDGSHFLGLQAGSNLTANRTLTIVTGDANRTLTLLGDVTLGAGTGNAFSTIAVSGQSDVVADQASDTLTLVAGSNITLTTNASGDSVTIAAATGLTITGTDNRIVRLNGTNAVQTSAVQIDDSGNVADIANLIYASSNVFTQAAKSDNTTYQAAADGLLVCLTNGSTGGGSIEAYTDASNPPTTLVGKANFSNEYVTITVPVKKGNFYKFVTNVDSGSASTTGTWTAVGTVG